MSGSEPDALPLGYWAISNNILTLLTIYKQLLFKYYYLQTNQVIIKFDNLYFLNLLRFYASKDAKTPNSTAKNIDSLPFKKKKL